MEFLIGLLIVMFIIPSGKIDYYLQDYNTEYKILLNEYCPSKKYFNPNKIQIKFTDFKDYRKVKEQRDTVALCRRMYPVAFTIEVDKNTWEMLSEGHRRQLFFHEAAHCYLGIDHNDSIPHYMNSYVDFKLSENVVREQVIEDIKRTCNTK